MRHCRKRIAFGELTNLHRAIFGDGFPDHAGRLRDTDIQVFGDPCVSPALLGEGMAQYAHYLDMRLTDVEADPYEGQDRFQTQVELACWAHIELLRIHPFHDGNGRTARVLMNLLLRRSGLRPIELKREHGYSGILRSAIRDHRPEAFVALVIRQIDEENARLIAEAERRRRILQHKRRRR